MIKDKNGCEFSVSHKFGSFTGLDDCGYYTFSPFSQDVEDPDLTIEDTTRNMICYDYSECEVKWQVDPLPPDIDERSHKITYHFGDWIYSRDYDSEYYFKVDLDSGEIVDHWPVDRFRIAGEEFEFEHEVTSLFVVDGDRIVLYSGAQFLCVDTTGEILWDRDDPVGWDLPQRNQEGRFHKIRYWERRGTWGVFKLDTKTGEIVDVIADPRGVKDDIIKD